MQWKWTWYGSFWAHHRAVWAQLPLGGFHTKFIDIALANDFIPYSGGEFRKKGGKLREKEVNSGKRKWIQEKGRRIQEKGGEFKKREVNSRKIRWPQGKGGEFKEKVYSGKRMWVQAEAHLRYNQWESGFFAKNEKKMLVFKLEWPLNFYQNQ